MSRPDSVVLEPGARLKLETERSCRGGEWGGAGGGDILGGSTKNTNPTSESACTCLSPCLAGTDPELGV